MSRASVFIHGAQLAPAVRKSWQQRFEALGYRTLAPYPFLSRRRALHLARSELSRTSLQGA